MILNTAPQDQAVLSNVGNVGEFRIRNSAKAFNILSSGLYANKIRAIIRELSCNAVDAHVAAGTQNTPYDVHLPNTLEPWFSIRDYGIGMTHADVINVYTTYFESTKTESNEFIGALGLGSKSPFSYTDNFTITAIKNGMRGIYTAFINEQGVPSIAKMMEEKTTEPSGVEVKFSVNSSYDFGKFINEAKEVYKFFKHRPVITGVSEFKFIEPTYSDKNIVPGVHVTSNGSHSSSYAIMGNIAYPIQVPNAETNLGKLSELLECGLVIEFDIGELDFQASREGLSYVPLTINNIKKRLADLNNQLAKHIADNADKIQNLWERAFYLYNRHQSRLWSQAVGKYVKDTNFSLFNANNSSRWLDLKSFNFTEEDLASKYNIVIKNFHYEKHQNRCHNMRKRSWHNPDAAAKDTYQEGWPVAVSQGTVFVFNDTTVRAGNRVKNAWRTGEGGGDNVYVIEPADRSKPINRKQFLIDIANPPESKLKLVSSLPKIDRKSTSAKNVSILILSVSRRGRRRDTYSWQPAGKLDSFKDTETYYYFPVKGFSAETKISDVKLLRDHLSQSVFNGSLYGVRKQDLAAVQAKKNWVLVDEEMPNRIKRMVTNSLMSIVRGQLSIEDHIEYYNYAKKYISDLESPFIIFCEFFASTPVIQHSVRNSLSVLCRMYSIDEQNPEFLQATVSKYTNEFMKIKERYPLLNHLSYCSDGAAIADYINLVDKKGKPTQNN